MFHLAVIQKFDIRKFPRIRYAKWKHLKKQQMKRSINAENVFYYMWHTRKVDVDLENYNEKGAHASCNVVTLLNTC